MKYLHSLHVSLHCLCLPSPETGGWWNTKGCEVVSKQYGYSVCYCNHTTNFALLLQVYEAEVTFPSPISAMLVLCRLLSTVCAAICSSCSVCLRVCVCQRSQENERALQVLTFIGCGVSLCGLLFTFILFIAVG